MVSVITFPNSILNALNYNEQKVNDGRAECLHAENFLLDVDQLKFYDKLNRFQNQMELNTKIKTKLLHVSLNFDPSEKLSNKELVEIGTTYMDKLGFGEQPYLLYRHDDAGHPHIHILTTTIKNDSSPIYVHNIGRNQSQKARLEIENEFGLIKADGRNNNQPNEIPPVDIEKAIYGKAETKRSIINVLDAVITRYRYTSLSELNAVLSLGNVIADRGKEGGRIHRTNGLVYRVLDKQGNKVGKPIKASSIYSKPTLAEFENKFQENKIRRYSKRTELKDEISKVLASTQNMQQFILGLKNQRIDTVIRRNDSGFIYGITFIDHKSKCVFNGSDLHKQLSAAGIQQRFASTNEPVKIKPAPTTRDQKEPKSQPASSFQQKDFHFEIIRHKEKSPDELIKQYDLLKQLIAVEKSFNPVPFGLTRKKRKKKKKRNPGF